MTGIHGGIIIPSLIDQTQAGLILCQSYNEKRCI